MMKKQRTFKPVVTSAVAVLALLSIGHAQTGKSSPPLLQGEIDKDPHATGLRPPTPEEIAWMEENMIVTRSVRLNALGLERIKAFRKKKGLTDLTPAEAEVVEFGEEPVGLTAAKGGIEEWLMEYRPLLQRQLPDSVDNSELPAFPPIRSQGSIGSCACFSTTYYGMTHMVGLVRGWDNHNPDNTTKFSPKWTYNMVNNGGDGGSWPSQAIAVSLKHGCATWAEFPYVGNGGDPVNYREWCLDPEVWENAIGFRMNETGYTLDVSTEEGLEVLKTMLADGYVNIFCTYISSWDRKYVQDDPADPDDDEFVGESICRYVNGSSGSHAMTIVGYNDHIWCDVNENEIVDEGEKGALKIANSWGTGWYNGGFGWLAYDALKLVSAVPGGPTEGRRGAFWADRTYWYNAREEYAPKLLAEFTLKHARRRQIYVQLGLSDTGETEPAATWKPDAIYGSGGNYGFDGLDYTSNPEDAPEATFVFDFTDLAEASWFPGDEQRWHVVVKDQMSDGYVADALDARLVDVVEEVEDLADNAPQTADGETVTLYSEYTWSDSSHFASPEGSNEWPYTSWATAAHSIRDALDAASDGDGVWVGDGTYSEKAEIVISKAVHMQSRKGPDVTVIDGGGAFRCIRIMHADAVVEGFTLTNGESGRDFGGGIQLWHGGTVRGCIITGNSSHQSAGGVFCDGGGTVENCLIIDNWALINGGGVYCGWGGTVKNCAISANSANGSGDGIFCYYGAEIRNSILYDNNGENYHNEGDDISYEYCCTTPALTGEGNISNPPQFEDPPGGDYRLAGSSPCINAGSNLHAAGMVDLDRQPRIQYDTVDMGPYEAGGTVYVSPTGSNVYPYLSWETASTLIGPAVDAAEEANTVLVADGTYAEPERVYINEVITLQSMNGPAATVLDAQNAHRGIYVLDVEAVIDGFTIANGDAGTNDGGGVYLDRHGLLQNCVVENSHSGRYGGGIFLCEGAVVRDCTISGNSADLDGGGVYICERGILERCVVSENTAGRDGGGIYSVESDGEVYNCLVTDNEADGYGGGVYCLIDNFIWNCTVSGNHANEGGGVCVADGATARNCIIYFNTSDAGSDNWYNYSGPTAFLWCCTTPDPGDPSNITDDPEFVNPGIDYHLLVTSPCRDTGNNDYAGGDEDLDRNPRIVNNTVDMGAYEFQGKKKKVDPGIDLSR